VEEALNRRPCGIAAPRARMLSVRPYPCTRSTRSRARRPLCCATRARRGRAVDVSKLAEVLGELIRRARAHRGVASSRDRRRRGVARGSQGRASHADGAVRVQVELEAELARTLIARILERPFRLGDPRAPSPPRWREPRSPSSCRFVRRAHGRPKFASARGRGAPHGSGRTKVALAGHRCGSAPRGSPPGIRRLRKSPRFRARAPHELASIAELARVAWCRGGEIDAEAIDVYALEPGDVWMPGRGWLLARLPRAAPTWSAGALGCAGAARASALGRDPRRTRTNRASGRRADLGRRGEALSDSEHDHDTATSEVVLDARSSSA